MVPQMGEKEGQNSKMEFKRSKFKPIGSKMEPQRSKMKPARSKIEPKGSLWYPRWTKTEPKTSKWSSTDQKSSPQGPTWIPKIKNGAHRVQNGAQSTFMVPQINEKRSQNSKMELKRLKIKPTGSKI